MNKLELMKQSIKKTTGRTGLVLKKHSPEILMGVGIISAVGSSVLACKATLKVEPIIDEANVKLDMVQRVAENPEVYEGDYTVKDANRDKTVIYTQTAVELSKLYTPAVTLGIFSAACVLSAHNIMKKRNIAVIAAYKAVEQTLSDYRGRVVEELGIDKDRQFRYGLKKDDILEGVTDEKGKTKEVKKEIDVINPNDISQYARFFDESCAEWTKTPEYNLQILTAKQNFANDILRSRGHLFLNEVYEMLGMEHSSAGAVVGWIFNDVETDFVDFNIYDGAYKANRAFVNGYERSILLDFNVDGVIYDLI